MSVPYRKWLQFDEATLECKWLLPGAIQRVWTDKHRNTCRIGKYNPIEWMMNHWWYSIFRPVAGIGFKSLLNMDEIVDVKWDINLIKIANHEPLASVDLTQGFVGNSNPWLASIVSGKYYDGSNAWDSYPPPQIAGYNPTTIELHAQWYSEELTTYMYSWKAGGGNGVEANRYQDDFFRNGAYFKMDLMAGLSPGNKCTFTLRPMVMTVRYFNPVVNKCLVNDAERYWVPTTGGIEFKLVGLGFNNSDAELDGEGDSRPGGWDDLVDVIEFWKQQDMHSFVVHSGNKYIDIYTEGSGEVYEGYHSAKLEIDSENNEAALYPYPFPELLPNTEYHLAFYYLNSVAGKTAKFSIQAGSRYLKEDGSWGPMFEVHYFILPNVTEWTLHELDFVTWGFGGPTLGHVLIFQENAAASSEIYFDAFSLNAHIINGGFEDWTGLHPTGWWITYTPDSIVSREEGSPGGAYTATLDEGVYTSTALAAEIKAQLDATGSGLTFTVTFNESTGKFTIAGSGFNILWKTGPHGSDNLDDHAGTLIGFQDYADKTGSDSYISDNVVTGSPYAILRRADGDFTVDSNVQITIPSNKFPNLEEGSYIMRVIKEGMDFTPRASSVDVWGWAGDWRCTIGGLVSEGERISIEARDAPPAEEPREKGGSIVLMELSKKDLEDNITKEYWSFDDVRCPDKFYEGIITEVSSFRRGIDDKTGLFKVADCTVKMTNHDKKFSKLLATHILKNQIATFYHAFIDEKGHDKREIVSMVVEDYNIQGTSFEMILKDVSQKYFKKNLPFLKATKKRFNNVHSDYEGVPLPDILGKAKYIGEEEKGAVEALYVNTKNYTYLAAGGKLHEITEVYSDNVLKTETTHWTKKYGDGFTFIKFTSDQGDNRITFNCEGYRNSAWDSENGYIQNPAYICCYVLMTLMGVPLDFVDYGSVEEMASLYVVMGMETSGKLICAEDQQSAMEIFRELLFSFGMKCWISKEGKFTFGRKDMSAFSTDTIIFEQQDLLDVLYRKMGLKDAVTRGKVEWDYIPAHNLYKASKDFPRDEEDNDEDDDEIITSDDPLTVRNFRPLDGAVDVAPQAVIGVGNSIGIHFNRAVNKGSGDVVVYDSGDNVFETIPVTGAKVRVIGRLNRRSIIDLTKNFVEGESYYVKIGSKCFYDSDGNYYDGITDKTTWNFTVGGEVADPDPPCRSGRRKWFRRIRRGERITRDDVGEIWICPRPVESDDEGEVTPPAEVDEDNSGDSTRDGVGGVDDRYGEGLEDSIIRRTRTRR